MALGRTALASVTSLYFDLSAHIEGDVTRYLDLSTGLSQSTILSLFKPMTP